MWAEREVNLPIGAVTLCQDDGGICALRFGGSGSRDETPLLLQAEQELTEYFAGRRRHFSVPLSIHGTSFQLQVWHALLGIPYGETISYGELARRIGKPKACRAVGGAIHRNPILIAIPCHRVIGSDGSLTGFREGLKYKKMLLETEGITL